MDSGVPPGCAARFAPTKRLAAGGYGTVWHATQKGLDRPVALKVLHREAVQDADALERFQNEARLTAGLRHENIVVVIDHGVEDGVPWIAYEYVPGHTLREELAGRPLRLSRCLRFARQVAAALEEAHRHGVLHRDIKPENLLVPRKDEVKVADFGLARRTDAAQQTSAGLIVGTPGYIAPERIRGEPATTAGDVYAVGVLLFEMLTGAVPFPGGTPMEMLARQAKEDAPAPSSRAAGIPEDVDRLVLQALARDPRARPASARALLDAIERLRERHGIGAEESIEGPPPELVATARRSRMPQTSVARRPSLAVVTGKGRPLALTLAVLLVVAGAVRWTRGPAPAVAPTAAPVASLWADPRWRALEVELARLLSYREERITAWRHGPDPYESGASQEAAALELVGRFGRDAGRDLADLDALSARAQALREGSGGHPAGRVLDARICCYRFLLEHGLERNRAIAEELAKHAIVTPADFMEFLADLESRRLPAQLLARLQRGLTTEREAIELVADHVTEAGDHLPLLFDDLRWVAFWLGQIGRTVTTERGVAHAVFDLTWRLERLTGVVRAPAGRVAKGFWNWGRLGSRIPEGRRSLEDMLEAMAALSRVAPRAKPGLDELAQRARAELADQARARERH